MSKLSLHGFNNLTKNLSFSLYKLHYLQDTSTNLAYNAYINERFSSANLNTFLAEVCHAIGGNILNVAQQDYLPQGASVTLMISEELEPVRNLDNKAKSIVAHLDKSHLCIHTYPEESPQKGIAIFRADIELSTCGVISPLSVLNEVIDEFDADVVDIDYRIRGMTRDKQGRKCFIDKQLATIADYLGGAVNTEFTISTHQLPKQNLFHSKLCRKNVDVEKYLFASKSEQFSTEQISVIEASIRSELQQLFTQTSDS